MRSTKKSKFIHWSRYVLSFMLLARFAQLFQYLHEIWLTIFFCRVRISNTVPQNSSSVPFRKGFCFLLPSSANISMAYFFDLTEATRYPLNFFPNKFLSCRCNKSTSFLKISLDCSTGQLRGAKMSYLLKYVM